MSGHKSQLLHSALESFFRGKDLLATTVVPVTEHRCGKVSLRVIDFFVTNYAKERNLTYTHNGRAVSIYLDYRSQLRAYTKRYFDPFCRRERITFSDGTSNVVSTVGQLNFFRWVIERGLLEVCRRHAADVERAMSASCHAPKPAKRKAVTPAPALRKCCSHRGTLRLKF